MLGQHQDPRVSTLPGCGRAIRQCRKNALNELMGGLPAEGDPRPRRWRVGRSFRLGVVLAGPAEAALARIMLARGPVTLQLPYHTPTHPHSRQ